jgi:hypothetical protein
VRARSARYIVCTKPFNLKRTVLYTIVDLANRLRGTENLVFGFGQETDEQCLDTLKRLEAGESEISQRNFVRLNVDWMRA